MKSQTIAAQTQKAYQDGFDDGLKCRPDYRRKAVDGDYSQGYSHGVAVYYQRFEQAAKPKLPEIPGERYEAGFSAAQNGDRPYWADTEYLAGWAAGISLNQDGSVKYGSAYMASCPSDRTRQEWNHEA